MLFNVPVTILFKMNLILPIWLLLCFTLSHFIRTVSSSEPRVVCYYANWSVYRPGTAKFNPQNINPYLCTHLIYAFGGFTKDNALKPFDKYQDIEKGGYAKFTGLKTYNNRLKVLLAIGGWNEGSTRFSPMVASKSSRREFIRNAIKFLRQNHFDGLDMDWEYPAFRDGGKPKDREHYAKLVKEMRQEFQRESDKTGKDRLLITMAVPAGIEYIQKGYDVKTLNNWSSLDTTGDIVVEANTLSNKGAAYFVGTCFIYLDWMNLLTYDYHSAYESAVNHHAPLYPLEEPNEYSVDDELNIDYTIKYYLENGADKDKLVLGIPTYGRSYTLFNPDAFALGSPADGPGEQGDATREKGYLAYYEICENIKGKRTKRETDSDDDEEYSESSDEETDDEDIPWTVVKANPEAMGPYAYKGNQWVGYDDIDIVKKKAEYVADKNLGGIMFWTVDNDDFRGNCHGKPYPLIEAAKEALISKLGQTDNAIPSDRSLGGTSSSRRRNRPTSTQPTTSSAAKLRESDKKTTTPSWSTPEPPTTPDPGADFKCKDEGFFQHPRDCKKYFWCLDSGPSNLGIVAHQFTCPSGLYFNKAADSCDFARNVPCKKSTPTTTTKKPKHKHHSTSTTSTTTSTTSTTTTPKPTSIRPIKLSSRSSLLFRTTTTSTTTTAEPTPVVEVEEPYEDEPEEDPRVIKELIDLIKKVGGVEQLEKHLKLAESHSPAAPTSAPASQKLYQRVLQARKENKPSLLDKFNGVKNLPPNGATYYDADLEKLSEHKKARKERPKYTTINRARSQSPTTKEDAPIDDDDTPDSELSNSRQLQSEIPTSDNEDSLSVKPLPQYVNIRRNKPTPATNVDEDNDSDEEKNSFEQQETEENQPSDPQSLPRYVTISRQRQDKASSTPKYTELHRDIPQIQEEIKSEPGLSSLPHYISLVRSTPEPSTLTVQISTLLNSNNTKVEESSSTTTSIPVTDTSSEAPVTTTKPTITNQRRRRPTVSTATTQSTTISSTQVSSERNYAFIRRTRPTARPRANEISNDDKRTRYIRSTTPQSNDDDKTNIARKDDTSYLNRGRSRVHFETGDLSSLTSADGSEPEFVPKSRSSVVQPIRRYRPKIEQIADSAVGATDSEASAVTLEGRRAEPLERGRSKFRIQDILDDITNDEEDETTTQNVKFVSRTPRPRPFSRSVIRNENSRTSIPTLSSRRQTKIPYGRSRNSPLVRPTEEADDDDDYHPKHDDISISETVIEENSHLEDTSDSDEDGVSRRRIVIKKIKVTSTDNVNPDDNIDSTTKRAEAQNRPEDNNRSRKLRIVRKRPASTSTTTTTESPRVESSPTPNRIRKIIRKKILPTSSEQTEREINTENRLEISANYGEKSRPVSTTTTTSTVPTTTIEIETTGPVSEEDEDDNEREDNIKEDDDNDLDDGENSDEDDDEEDHSDNNLDEDDEQTENEPEETTTTKEVDTTLPPTTTSTSSTEAPTTLITTPSTTTTTTTTPSPFSSSSLQPPRNRFERPSYRPRRPVVSSTEAAPSSSPRTYSRKFNVGAYTPSPSGEDRNRVVSSSRRPLFSSRPFGRKPSSTARTTQQFEESDDDLDESVDDEEPKLVLVPEGQLFTRNPIKQNDEVNEKQDAKPSSRRPFGTKAVSSTQSPNRLNPALANKNRTAIFVKGNRVQNIPKQYIVGTSTARSEEPTTLSVDENYITTQASVQQTDSTDSDDEYLSYTEATVNEIDKEFTTNPDVIDMVTTTDEYLEFIAENEEDLEATTFDRPTTVKHIFSVSEAEDSSEKSTTSAPANTTTEAQNIFHSSLDKIFSVSRVIEINSKEDKHRVNKNNESRLIEAGEIMVEKKPTVDKVGEVSRYTLIKVVEEEIPIYLTKYGHVYPVDNPPDNHIKIDEARNARSYVNFADSGKDNLVASESNSQVVRQNKVITAKPVEDFVLYEGMKEYNDPKDDSDDAASAITYDTFPSHWQFIPAAFETEKEREKEKERKEYVKSNVDISEDLKQIFGEDNSGEPVGRKVGGTKGSSNVLQPFVVFSAPVDEKIEETDRKIVNFVKLEVINTESRNSKSINSSSVENTIKYPFNISITPSEQKESTTEKLTTQTVTSSTEIPITLEQTTSESPTTPKSAVERLSVLARKRAKLQFPKRLPGSTEGKTQITTQKTTTQRSKTPVPSIAQRFNRPNNLSPTKNRFVASRSQNLPVDVRNSNKKPLAPKPNTTTGKVQNDSTTTLRSLYRPLRPLRGPGFVPRRQNPPTTTQISLES